MIKFSMPPLSILQIDAGILGDVLLTLVNGGAVAMLGVAGVSMIIAALCVVMVKEKPYSTRLNFWLSSSA